MSEQNEWRVLKTEEIAQLSFEEAIKRLEKVVEWLESGSPPLEKSIELFQEGMYLSNHCNNILTSIEKKVEILVEENGELTRKPLILKEED